MKSDQPSECQLLTKLSDACAHVTTHEPLSRHTTWGIGGPARYYAEPASEDEISDLIRVARCCSLPFAVIGHGSNLLVGERGTSGLVVKLGRRFSKTTIDGESIHVEAGAYVPRVARMACTHGLTGIEHIVGIPGSFGGLVAMNGGSRRQSIGTKIDTVRAIDRRGEVHHFRSRECGFAYRTSRFQTSELIVVQALLSLAEGNRSEIRRESLSILRERRSKFPLRTMNCGSVFLCTKDMYETVGPPGKLIEDAGLKGRRSGGLHVSPQHANFFINDGTGTFADVVTLIQDVREVVFRATGHVLMCEVRYLDEQGGFSSVSDILPEVS